MPEHQLPRRDFFRRAGASAALGLAPQLAKPARAWIIVALNWEYNDEFSYVEGEIPHTELFYDQAEAEAECLRLCQEFFAAQSPAEFEIDWDHYFFPSGYDEPDFDQETMTWEQVREAGFPDPYYVLELNLPGEPAP